MPGSAHDSFITRRPYATAGVAAALLLVILLAAQFVAVLLTVFAGILLAILLGGISHELSHGTALPRGLALFLTIIGFAGILVGLWALAGPDISTQVNALADILPSATRRLADRLRTSAEEYKWLQRVLEPSQFLPPLSSVVGGVTNVFRNTLTVIVNTFIVFFIGIYGAATPEKYVEGIVWLIPKSRRPRAREILHAIGRALRWWLLARFIMMLIVGVLTAAGLSLAGIPSPIALGLVAALFSFVPYLGPILSVVPAVLVASVLSATKVLYVLLVYSTVQLLESYLIDPLIQERAVHIPPAAVITAQFIGGVGAGAVGVLLATPLAVVVIILVQTLYIEDVLGDDIALLGEH